MLGMSEDLEASTCDAEALRFCKELDFVQCLANPRYLQCRRIGSRFILLVLHFGQLTSTNHWIFSIERKVLAHSGYFSDPAFLNYLKYLKYWKRLEYAKYIMYAEVGFNSQFTFSQRVYYGVYVSCMCQDFRIACGSWTFSKKRVSAINVLIQHFERSSHLSLENTKKNIGKSIQYQRNIGHFF